jgi:hypothetical protein
LDCTKSQRGGEAGQWIPLKKNMVEILAKNKINLKMFFMFYYVENASSTS